ncbi:hypothetical protein TNCV_1391261 [Trichonephila clavipes]|nr:hypothetical protein TNCV_1391261 [Trichonephila clavipes]
MFSQEAMTSNKRVYWTSRKRYKILLRESGLFYAEIARQQDSAPCHTAKLPKVCFRIVQSAARKGQEQSQSQSYRKLVASFGTIVCMRPP